jgi:hypothetical protein
MCVFLKLVIEVALHEYKNSSRVIEMLIGVYNFLVGLTGATGIASDFSRNVVYLRGFMIDNRNNHEVEEYDEWLTHGKNSLLRRN